MIIEKATKNDLQEILDLQYLAYQSEAELLNDFSIPPLKQTLDEVIEEYEKGIILKVNFENMIIASVRGYVENETLYIGKLIVHPDYRRKGIGKRILLNIESHLDHARCELFTSTKSVNNIKLYEQVGYSVFDEKQVSESLAFIYLEKQ